VQAALIAVAGAALIALAWVTVLLVRARREVRRLRDRLATASRPRPRSAAGRAMQAVVETAARVRDQGVGGLLMSSLDDLSRFVTEDRAEIARVAGADGTVTVVFSDIEDSTALNERLGDRQWVRVLTAHDEQLRRVVRRHRGHVVKSQGDGYMIVFGEPAAAAHAAIALQSVLQRARHRPVRRTPFHVRIGMHVGTAVARDGDYFGRNVALAARVAAEAHGGQILVSDEFRAALDGWQGFEFVPYGEVELKGLADRHALWELSPQRSRS
jgi:class 3 adenylate cyclase